MNYLLLFAVTAIWGLGFIATKWTLVEFSAIWSNTLRFVFAAAIALPVVLSFRSYKMGLKKTMMVIGASLFLFLGMTLQTMGLVYTTAAKSGFITCLYSLIIPVILMFVLKRRYSIYFWGLLFQSLIGIALLCDLDLTSLNYGDLLTFLCAFAFAAHFLVVDRIGKHFPSAMELNSLQCIGVALFALPSALILESFPGWGSLTEVSSLLKISPLLGFLCVSFFSSFVAFGVLAHTQKFLPAHTVGLICLLESPLAALFGYIFLDEKLNPMNIVGGVLVLFSVLCIPLTEGDSWARLRARLKVNRKKVLNWPL
ncbi:MAG: DMT family transporter [Bdellovibrionota bacterium]